MSKCGITLYNVSAVWHTILAWHVRVLAHNSAITCLSYSCLISSENMQKNTKQRLFSYTVYSKGKHSIPIFFQFYILRMHKRLAVLEVDRSRMMSCTCWSYEADTTEECVNIKLNTWCIELWRTILNLSYNLGQSIGRLSHVLIVFLHHKWNGHRLRSPKRESVSWITSYWMV